MQTRITSTDHYKSVYGTYAQDLAYHEANELWKNKYMTNETLIFSISYTIVLF